VPFRLGRDPLMLDVQLFRNRASKDFKDTKFNTLEALQVTYVPIHQFVVDSGRGSIAKS